LIAFHGRHQDANRGRNRIFERSPLYNLAFGNRKAAHILFVYTLAKAIDEYRIILKTRVKLRLNCRDSRKHLKFLRNIRFKYYFIALTSLVMESVVGKRVDKERISFSLDAIRENSNPVIFFTESWIPILRMVLTFLSSQADVSAMGNQLADEGEILALASKVGALIHVSRESSESLFQPFSKLVTDR